MTNEHLLTYLREVLGASRSDSASVDHQCGPFQTDNDCDQRTTLLVDVEEEVRHGKCG